MKTNDLTLSAILLTLLIIFSQLSIPIGSIPITLQTLAVLLIGYLLPPKAAFLVTFSYFIGGLVGLPIFSNFQGGLHSVLLPSFGFILAFVPAAYFQAKYLEKFDASKISQLIIAGVLNFVITYLIGLIYMAIILNIYMDSNLTFIGILMTGLVPFILGDVLKIVVSIPLAKRLNPFIKSERTAH